MRVICIEETIQAGDVPTPSLEVGSEYNVVNRLKHKGIELFELAEFPRKDGLIFAYDVEAFAPLNGPDERERLEAWQAERLTKEDRMLMRIAEDMPEEALEPGVYDRIWKGIREHLNAPHE